MVQVYTGHGKGKTTAAIGLAIRALGHGWRVLMIQFMKGDLNYGELLFLKNIQNFNLIQSGLPTWVKKGEASGKDINMAREGLRKAEEAIKSENYELIILDEINVAVDHGLIQLEDVLKLIREKPKSLELVLTGRYAHPKILEVADLVSEVRAIKHPFAKGIEAREGIEF